MAVERLEGLANDLAKRLEGRPEARRWTVWAVVAMAVLTGVGFLLVGAGGPADPRPVETEGRRPLEGFGEIAFAVAPPGVTGATARWCALLANRDDTRIQGLRGQRDLRGYDGMLFVFDDDQTGAFVMGGVDIPLEIAWWSADGSLVTTAAMAPCPGQDSNACPHAPSGPYRTALETGAGGLARLGVAPGSRLTFGGSCP